MAVTLDDLVSKLQSARIANINRGGSRKRGESRMRSPIDTVDYFDKCFDLDLQLTRNEHTNKDKMACMLFDLANIPLPMVMGRKLREKHKRETCTGAEKRPTNENK